MGDQLPSPAASAAVPVQQRIIIWNEKGEPVLAAQPVLSKQHLQSIYFVAAAQPYVVEDPLDPDFGLYDGCTIAEVMIRKQMIRAAKTGDKDEVEKVMDRLLGKPKWIGESVQVHASYEDVLKSIEAKVKGASATPSNPIDVGTAEDIFGDLAS